MALAAPSEIKTLRDEMARIISKYKRLESDMADLISVERERDSTFTEMMMENGRLKRRLAYYENPNSPPSQDSIPSRQRKARVRDAGKDAGAGAVRKSPGRRRGHGGVSHGRGSEDTVRHEPEACPGCGGTQLTRVRTRKKVVTGIRTAPECVTMTHVVTGCRCAGCGTYTEGRMPGLPETSPGPWLLSYVVAQWEKGISIQSVSDSVCDLTGTRLCKAAIRHAVEAASKRMGPVADGMTGSLSRSKFLKMDETPMIMGDGGEGVRPGVIGDEAVSILAVGSRTAVVIDPDFPHRPIPITCDGYAAYNGFETRQRCWAHVLRGADQIRHARKDPVTAMLHQRLQLLFHEAKHLPPDIDEASYAGLTDRVACIAEAYGRLEFKFGTTLANAAPDLFTFVRHPGMHPTNNESERMLRRVVIHRKIRQRLVTPAGMRMFGVLMTCVMTWRRQKADLMGNLLGVLGAA